MRGRRAHEVRAGASIALVGAGAVALALWGVVAAGAVAAAWGAPSPATTDRPNILLLVAEDLSPRIGAFGDDVAVTPNLDRLTSQGVRYPNTFTTAGVCAPSRAALLTGVRQTALGAQHMRAYELQSFRAVPPPEVKAFPELLRRAGYFTFTTDKLDYQFSHVWPGSGPFTIWDRETWGYADWSGRPADKPFFGLINYEVTHESSLFPTTWPRSILHALVLLERLWHGGRPPSVVDPARVPVPPYYPDTETVRRDIAHQYDDARAMDEQVGETLAALERDGLADSTIVIWTSDHGDGLPRAKRELFDSGIRVPLIIRWPERFRPAGVEEGGVDERLVSFVDLGATILALAGVPPPAWMDGRVFAGAAPDPPRRYVFAARDRIDESWDRQRAVHDERYEYVRNYDAGTPGARRLSFRDNLDIMRELWRLQGEGGLDATQRRWFEPRPADELYDTWTDPHEVKNLEGDPSQRETLVRMQKALDEWIAERPDLGALPERGMIEAYWPGGEQPETSAPEVRLAPEADGFVRVELSSSTPGASLGYRVIDGVGNPGSWEIYTEPFTTRLGHTIEAKAVRYGWRESPVTVVPTV